MTDANALEITIVRLDPDLPLPGRARDDDAGMDLVARERMVIAAGGGRGLVPTGIRVAIPAGYGGFLLPRSSLALRHGVTLVNAPGLIDAGYRDEVKVALVNTDPGTDYTVERGDRIAQLVVLPVPKVVWNEVADLDGENRGGGFGHTGR
jgi:dUTP pyrophosphatase